VFYITTSLCSNRATCFWVTTNWCEMKKYKQFWIQLRKTSKICHRLKISPLGSTTVQLMSYLSFWKQLKYSALVLCTKIIFNFCDQIDVRSKMSPLKFHCLKTKSKEQFFKGLSDAPDYHINKPINFINMRLSTFFDTQG
jgi:hypothetical protein